jgi:PAS domain S-box-containing protein
MSIEQADSAALEPLELRRRLESAEEMVRAIREGEIDGLVVGADGRERVHTLRGADETYRIFVEAMGEGAANVALDGTILYCNRRFAELVGAPLEQTIGGSVFRFVGPQDEAEFRAFVWEAATATVARRDCRLLTDDGRALPVLVTATPFKTESVSSVCLLVTDLGEQHARLAAEAAGRAKDKFFAALSHELRTPLTPAMMLIGVTLARTDLPREVREDLGVVQQNLEVEARLIDDLLDLSRVISGKMRIQPAPVRGHELAEQAIAMCDGDCTAKRLTVERSLGAAHDVVVVDRARVLQALWNLLKNAIKFSREGGVVRVRTHNQGGAWVVEVEDQGIGIRPELLPRLFNAFEQGDPEVARQYGGMGLGLAISKAVIDLHQGTIGARSDGPGRGAVFTIALPLAQ